MIQDFLTKLNGKWRHNQRPYVSRPNEVYILGHILALAYWKLHYRSPHSYARSKLTIYGIFFLIWKFFFSIWNYLRRAVKNRETKLNESSSSGKKKWKCVN